MFIGFKLTKKSVKEKIYTRKVNLKARLINHSYGKNKMLKKLAKYNFYILCKTKTF